jgi:hypothetical protein
MRHAVSALTLTAVLLAATVGRGDVSVVLKDMQLPPGTAGYIDAMISGSDPLEIAGYEFRLSSSGPTRLEFVDPQPVAWLSDPGYLFQDDSADAAMLHPLVGGVSQTVLPGDTFIGSDMAASGRDVTVGADRLLARLYVTAATTLPPRPGDTFSISLARSDSTGFLDHAGNSIPFSRTPGIVTVVPEPSTLMMALVAAGLTLTVGCVKRTGVLGSEVTED